MKASWLVFWCILRVRHLLDQQLLRSGLPEDAFLRFVHFLVLLLCCQRRRVLRDKVVQKRNFVREPVRGVGEGPEKRRLAKSV